MGETLWRSPFISRNWRAARQQGWAFSFDRIFGQRNLSAFERALGSSTLRGVAYIEFLCTYSGSKLMRLPFSGRNEKLGTMNRILTEAARKRTERIEELERRVAQLERESEAARKAIERAKVLEGVAAERAQLLNDKDKQLAEVREAATKYYFRIQELERTLAEIGQKRSEEHTSELQSL